MLIFLLQELTRAHAPLVRYWRRLNSNWDQSKIVWNSTTHTPSKQCSIYICLRCNWKRYSRALRTRPKCYLTSFKKKKPHSRPIFEKFKAFHKDLPLKKKRALCNSIQFVVESIAQTDRAVSTFPLRPRLIERYVHDVLKIIEQVINHNFSYFDVYFSLKFIVQHWPPFFFVDFAVQSEKANRERFLFKEKIANLEKKNSFGISEWLRIVIPLVQ